MRNVVEAFDLRAGEPNVPENLRDNLFRAEGRTRECQQAFLSGNMIEIVYGPRIRVRTTQRLVDASKTSQPTPKSLVRMSRLAW